MPNLFTTRKHSVFDLEEPPQIDTTTFTISEEELTTEKSRVLPMTRSSTTTPLSLEQVSDLSIFHCQRTLFLVFEKSPCSRLTTST